MPWPYNDQAWREHNMVPLAPLRQAYLDSGITISEFARRMDMIRTQPNVDRARRAIGLRPDSDTRGVRAGPREFVTPLLAKRIADALELDYTDYGI